MKLRWALVLALVVATVGCSGMTVNNDYDREANFAQFETYAWYEGDMTLKEDFPLAHDRLVRAVEGQLSAKGLQRADTSPDLYVTYHADSDEQVRIDTDHFGYGYGPGWYWGGGMSTSTSRVRTYLQGTVVVDLWDANQKRLVWRGIASDTVSENPGSNENKINKAAERMFKNYPPKK